MANLLSPNRSSEPFSELDPDQYDRFVSRLAVLAREVEAPNFIGRIERDLAVLDGPLADLADDPSLITALELLDGIDRARLEFMRTKSDRVSAPEFPVRAASDASLGGALIFYWPGRSLSTGEAEVASRGFFDALDRPPMGLWIEAIARPIDVASDRFEIAIIAWTPPGLVERAEAGCRACTNGSLAMLCDASQKLSRQLRPILIDSPGKGA